MESYVTLPGLFEIFEGEQMPPSKNKSSKPPYKAECRKRQLNVRDTKAIIRHLVVNCEAYMKQDEKQMIADGISWAVDVEYRDETS